MTKLSKVFQPQVPDGADQVDSEEEEKGGGHGPDNDHQCGQGLDPQEVGVTMPDYPIIP